MTDYGYFRRANSENYTEGESEFEAAFDRWSSSEEDGSESESSSESESIDSDSEGSIGSETMSDM